jgi:hypothetical protein
MHSCCCICFIVWCGFGIYLIWIQNLFLNGFGNKFKWEKKRKRKKRKTLPAARWPGSPPETAYSLPFLADGPSEPSSFPPFLSRARVGRPRSRSGRALSLPCLANEWTSHVHCLARAGYEAAPTKSTEYPGISYPKTSY